MLSSCKLPYQYKIRKRNKSVETFSTVKPVTNVGEQKTNNKNRHNNIAHVKTV